MALITAPSPSIPDIDYEFHTITVDSVGQDSANTFTVYLNTPLRNVVQARLLGAHIHTTDTTEHCHVSIAELDSIFHGSGIEGSTTICCVTASAFCFEKLVCVDY
jgi:hypothetical protein